MKQMLLESSTLVNLEEEKSKELESSFQVMMLGTKDNGLQMFHMDMAFSLQLRMILSLDFSNMVFCKRYWRKCRMKWISLFLDFSRDTTRKNSLRSLQKISIRLQNMPPLKPKEISIRSLSRLNQLELGFEKRERK